MSRNEETYQRVSTAIDDQLANGTVPWRRPWSVSGLPRSVSTNRPYRGVNVLLLELANMAANHESNYWGTYRKLSELGGQVRKGQRGSLVTFWKRLNVADRDNPGERKHIPFLRGYTVFNVAQCDWQNGIPERFTPAQRENATNADAYGAILDYLDGHPTLSLTHGGDRAYYAPALDTVNVPSLERFETSAHYYATLYHELIHSTGHESRLARDLVGTMSTESYSREELVAELGAAMVSAVVGVQTPATLENAAAYIAGWRRRIAEDPKAVVWAAGRAQRAADMVLSAEPVTVGDDAVETLERVTA